MRSIVFFVVRCDFGSKNGDNKNNIAEHHLPTDNKIDWDSAECISFSMGLLPTTYSRK